MKPLLHTDEPLCQDGFLACGDGNCIERGLFCNGEKDCSDGSDENTCGKYNSKQEITPCKTGLAEGESANWAKETAGFWRKS